MPHRVFQTSKPHIRAGYDWALLGGATLFSVFCLVQILLMRFGRDQGIYAVVADVVLDGGMPYRDAWDFKPPGIFLVYVVAQALFGANEWAIRGIEVLSFASLYPIGWVLSKKLLGTGKIGLLGAALAVIIEAQLEFWHTSQPESFGGVLALGGLALCLPSSGQDAGTRRRSVLMVVGGMLLGLSALMKPHLAAVPIVVGMMTIWQMREARRFSAHAIRAFWLIGTGTLVPILGTVAWFAGRGAWDELHHTLFVFAPGYAATTWDPSYLPQFVYTAIKDWVTHFSALVALGMAAALALGQTSRDRMWILLLLAMAAPQLLGIAVQSKFFAYHFASVLPLGAMIAGLGLWRLWEHALRIGVVGATLYGALLVFAMRAREAVRDLSESFLDRSSRRIEAVFAPSPEREELVKGLYTVADVDYEANSKVADWLRANTSENSSVFIWGFEPAIYFQAKRKAATRFIYNVPQRVSWDNDWAREQLMKDLAANEPEAVVVERGDVFPFVTGNHLDSEGSLAGFPELKTWLFSKYSKITRIQDFDIYTQRKSHE